MADHSRIGRYEAKYLVPEQVAQEIREYARGICSPDRNVRADGQYIVNTLYFDTPGLRFYYDTRFKRFDRFKLRARYYGTDAEEGIWVELKHKRKNVTWKKRRRVEGVDWPAVAEGRVEAVAKTQRRQGVRSFEDAVWFLQARPIVHVRYVREPYVSDIDNYCRVTFDRDLRYRLANGSFDLSESGEWTSYDDSVTTLCPFDDSPVVVEIKTEMQVPVWVVRMVQYFDLGRRGFSKYCSAIDRSMI